MRRVALLLSFLLFLSGLSSPLVAHTQKDSWANLNSLKAGQGIEVIELQSKHHHGKFVTVTDDALTMKEKGSDVSVKRDDVVSVSTGSVAKRGEQALIGLAVGGAIGAGIGAISTSDHSTFCCSTKGIGALIGIVIGAPIGAVLGAVAPAHTTVYRAKPSGAPH